ncbi:toll-like receptor 4 [Neocloeon triangulifer]|uniref:toll-like receptor 4 n=1 Tax=Neocloeon triangulifer TaxID=2078957 RepID=UPI00286EF322|nr:toll-like receptor 4 [Neocloeon triangulifer]
MRLSVILLVACAVLVPTLNGELAPQECPSACSCHYYRVHWVASCSHRALSDVPSGLAPTTYMLELNGNALTDFFVDPEVKLRRIVLTNNNLKTLTKRNFKGLGLLIDVEVSGNQLTSISPDTFQGSPGLITFEARRNKDLTGPTDDSPFLESRSLQTLDLCDSGISIIGSNFFSKTPSLRKIILSGNPLRTIRPGAFAGLQGLDELHLANTLISHVAPADFAPDPPLRVLNLNQNRLNADKLKTLVSKLVHLEKLDISRCGLTLKASHVGTFAHCNWLHTLDTAFNDLSGLDLTRALGKLNHLEHLDLTSCNLNEKSFKSDVLSNLTRLRTLKVSDNTLGLINMTSVLQPLSKLHHLSVGNCQLRSTKFLRELPKVRQSLRSLDLSRNPLGDQEVNTAGTIFNQLESLDVSYCGLTTITKDAFSPAKNLITLAISGNKVQIESGALSDLTRLEKLYMRECNQRGAPPADVFPPESKLIELYLSGNPLDLDQNQVVPQHLKNLQVLDVSECYLRKITASSLVGAQNLVKLEASGNILSSLDDALPDLGTLAPKLEILDLRNSRVRRITPEAVDGCSRLQAVYLEENPLQCDCYMARLWQWAISKGVALHERRGSALLRCQGQAELWPKPLDSLIC